MYKRKDQQAVCKAIEDKEATRKDREYRKSSRQYQFDEENERFEVCITTREQ